MFSIFREKRGLIILFVTLLGLILLSMEYSFLLFHVLVELFSIIIAVNIFTIAWNSRRRLDNSFLLFIGINFLFIALIDILHTLAYSGMNVFEGYDANLPTQLWIAARYCQAVTMILASFFIIRRINVGLTTLGMMTITVTLLALIFSGWFPDCYVVGSGLTTFKIASEYVIIAILFGAMLHLRKRRDALDINVYWLIQGSLAFMMASEFAFTQYVGVYAPVNALGHIFKVTEFYLLYLAIVRTGISEPFRLLFKELKESEERIRATLDTAPILVVDLDQKLRIRLVNRGVEQMMGVKAKYLIGQGIDRVFIPEAEGVLNSELSSSTEERSSTFDLPMRSLDPHRIVEWRWCRTPTGYLMIGLDVTVERAVQQRMDDLAKNHKVVHKILRHDLKNQLLVISGYLEMFELKGDPKHLSGMRSALTKGNSIIDMTRNLEMALDSSLPLEKVEVDQIAQKIVANLDSGGVQIDLEGRLSILGDPAMSSVLQNLINNALLHASPQHIHLRMWQDATGGHLQVEDDGVGVPETLRDHLFGEGVKGDSLGSSGMGLYLVKKVVERYGGKVSYHPLLPHGSSFTLDLPPI